MKTKPEKPAPKLGAHPIIPVQTLINLMGAEQWKKILKWIKEEYGTKEIHLGYHRQFQGAEVYLTKRGEHIGSVAEIVTRMNKKRKRK